MPQITWWIFPSLNVHMCFVLGKKAGQLHKTHPTVSVSLLDVLTFYQPSLPLGYRWMRKDWEGKALWVVCLSPPPCVVIFRLCGWWMEGGKIVLGRPPFLGQTHCLLCAVKTSSRVQQSVVFWGLSSHLPGCGCGHYTLSLHSLWTSLFPCVMALVRRISRWWQRSFKSSAASFWAQSPVWPHGGQDS